MHWADVLAKKLLEKSKEHVVATGITPSGQIHVGNMREILTGDMIYRSLKKFGAKARLIYIGDTIDPLRKLYPFLDKSYEKYIGMPLSEIPCPCGKHNSYAWHFLQPFLDALKKLGIEQQTLLTHEMYKEGRYKESAKIVLEKSVKIKEILERISKRQLPKNWMPYNTICSSCNRLTTTKAIDYKYPYVYYKCECGYEGKADIRKGEGKLPWRVDWPARWSFLNVTCEPFGKDHGAAGGSYDTGIAIAKEIFKISPPPKIIYEWIQLKGKGAMSSSTGIVVTTSEMLKMTPPEVLRFLIAKQNPNKHIDFDPQTSVVKLVDEFDKYERIYYGIEKGIDEEHEKRTYELSLPNMHAKIPEKMCVQIPYMHLVTLIQINNSFEGIKKILKRTSQISKLNKVEEEKLKERVEYARYWLENFAPEYVKFSVKEDLPKIELSKEQKSLLKEISEKFKKIEWNADVIHNTIYEISKSKNLNPKLAFQAIYLLILGKMKGPRAGYFLSSLEREFVVKRLQN